VNRTHARTEARRGAARRRSKRFRLATLDSVARERSTKTRSAGPRTLRSRAPPAACRRSRPLPVVHGGRLRTEHHRWQLAFASDTGALGTAGRSSCSRIPATQGPRARVPRTLREERPRSAIPEVLSVVGNLLDDPGLRPESSSSEGLSTASHQPVERARCLFRPSSGTAALTGLRQRERGLPCARASRSSSRTGRWLPTRLRFDPRRPQLEKG